MPTFPIQLCQILDRIFRWVQQGCHQYDRTWTKSAPTHPESEFTHLHFRRQRIIGFAVEAFRNKVRPLPSYTMVFYTEVFASAKVAASRTVHSKHHIDIPLPQGG